MPEKLKRIFEKEYGKKQGDLIFYKYSNKHHLDMDHSKHNAHKSAELILKGNDRYIHHMYKHLRKEHPSTRKRMIERRY